MFIAPLTSDLYIDFDTLSMALSLVKTSLARDAWPPIPAQRLAPFSYFPVV